MSRFNKFLNDLNEGSKTLNVAKVPLPRAKTYAEGVYGSEEELKKDIPDFDKNYLTLASLYNKSLDIDRIKMPVIEPTDMDTFNKRLNAGSIDIFKPHSLKKKPFPHPKDQGGMDKSEGNKWVTLGQKDGSKDDDVVKAKLTKIAANRLKPIQGQLWLEKLVNNIKKFGVPKAGSPVLETTLIVSKEGYILDGHHRHGQVMLVNPKLKMKALEVPLDIKTLLEMGRTYGAAIGNKGKA